MDVVMWGFKSLMCREVFDRIQTCFNEIPISAGCMGMMALGREDTKGQLRVAEQGGIQPLVRLLRVHKTSYRVILAVIQTIASLCIGMRTVIRQLHPCIRRHYVSLRFYEVISYFEWWLWARYS